ncbi:hypothetical protein Lmor_2730 [Legionella moravica]|uniref:Uncharacterized protein n=1 Tax=Legionella moravica TaxID=39962 RepID=A0A378JWY5_9GAMM|nr:MULTISPECIES: bacteriophage holin [Legionella]KTD31233.1 hypothetical protein Lmor_2730 [Legionella moravica]RUR19495.1 hypothetical protein ELY21_04550 [Legionella sp. km535]STX61908.1 Uncharacterised protein [Legionella moravica]
MNGCKLSPVGLGLSLGVLWGLSMLFLGISAYYYSYGKPFVEAVASLYLGYEPSIKGSIIGGICGFINAFITGFLIAWLYNKFSCCKCSCCGTKNKEETKA